MSGKRYTEEFKIEAVRQVTERGHPAAGVASRFEVTTRSMARAWRQQQGRGPCMPVLFDGKPGQQRKDDRVLRFR